MALQVQEVQEPGEGFTIAGKEVLVHDPSKYGSNDAHSTTRVPVSLLTKLPDYSETETAMGNKWIDDSPVYRKVIVYDHHSTTGNNIDPLAGYTRNAFVTGLATVIKMEGWATGVSGRVYHFNNSFFGSLLISEQQNDLQSVQVRVDSSNAGYLEYLNNTSEVVNQYVTILEYTKTE